MNKTTLRLLKYIIGGGLASLLDLFLLYVFTDLLGVYYMYSQVLSFCISFIFGYSFQKYVTFQNASKKHLSQASLFLGFQLIGLVGNLAIMYILVDYFGIYYLYASIIAKGVVFVWNFTMNHFYTRPPGKSVL